MGMERQENKRCGKHDRQADDNAQSLRQFCCMNRHEPAYSQVELDSNILNFCILIVRDANRFKRDEVCQSPALVPKNTFMFVQDLAGKSICRDRICRLSFTRSKFC